VKVDTLEDCLPRMIARIDVVPFGSGTAGTNLLIVPFHGRVISSCCATDAGSIEK
jgi:hypothetical protein